MRSPGKPLTETVAEAAARAAFADARPRVHNAFKVALGQSTLVRALLQAADTGGLNDDRSGCSRAHRQYGPTHSAL